MGYFKKTPLGLAARSGGLHRYDAKSIVSVIQSRDRCFSCATTLNQNNRKDEHVVPDWLIRLQGLSHDFVGLPNRQSIAYSKWRLPCCAQCNEDYARIFEEPISKLFKGGYAQFLEFFRSGGDHLIYAWLGFVAAKHTLASGGRKWTPDARIKTKMLIETCDLESLCWQLALAQNLRLGGENRHIRRLHCIPWRPTAMANQPYGLFSDGQAGSIFLSCNGISLVASFSDGAPCGQAERFQALLGNNALSTIQVLEFMARLERTAYMHEKRYFRQFSIGNTSIIDRPKEPLKSTFRVPKNIANILHLGSAGQYVARVALNSPDWTQYLSDAIEGKTSFLHESLGPVFIDEDSLPYGPIKDDEYDARCVECLTVADMYLPANFDEMTKTWGLRT